jgi:hypothetical protein
MLLRCKEKEKIGIFQGFQMDFGMILKDFIPKAIPK